MFKIDRVQAFSDGVFAILVTILVLDFHVPEYVEGHLIDSVIKMWPILLAYTISFTYIGTLWLFHHDFFSLLKHTTPVLNLINLVMLFSITLLNFPTATISATLTTGNLDDLKTAFVLYDIVALLVSFTFTILYRYARKHHELKREDASEEHEIRVITEDPLISMSIYLVSIISASFSVVVSGIFLLAGIIWHAIAYVRLSKNTRKVIKR